MASGNRRTRGSPFANANTGSARWTRSTARHSPILPEGTLAQDYLAQDLQLHSPGPSWRGQSDVRLLSPGLAEMPFGEIPMVTAAADLHGRGQANYVYIGEEGVQIPSYTHTAAVSMADTSPSRRLLLTPTNVSDPSTPTWHPTARLPARSFSPANVNVSRNFDVEVVHDPVFEAFPRSPVQQKLPSFEPFPRSPVQQARYPRSPAQQPAPKAVDGNASQGPWIMEKDTLDLLAARTAHAVMSELQGAGPTFTSMGSCAETMQRSLQSIWSCTEAMEKSLKVLQGFQQELAQHVHELRNDKAVVAPAQSAEKVLEKQIQEGIDVAEKVYAERKLEQRLAKADEATAETDKLIAEEAAARNYVFAVRRAAEEKAAAEKAAVEKASLDKVLAERRERGATKEQVFAERLAAERVNRFVAEFSKSAPAVSTPLAVAPAETSSESAPSEAAALSDTSSGWPAFQEQHALQDPGARLTAERLREAWEAQAYGSTNDSRRGSNRANHSYDITVARNGHLQTF